MTPLETIERQCAVLACARARLREEVEDLTDQIETAKRAHRRAIERCVATAAREQNVLTELVQSNPNAFQKPRTQIYHAIKVGYRKCTGSIDWDDDDQVVKLIRKHFPEQAEVLIRTTEVPIRSALKELTVADLKRIGCTAIETGDAVVVKPVDTEIDKVVNALLKEATEDLTESEPCVVAGR